MKTEVNIKSLIDKMIIINVDGSKSNERIKNEVIEALLNALKIADSNNFNKCHECSSSRARCDD